MKNVIFTLFLLVSFTVIGQDFEQNWKNVIEFEETGSIKSANDEVAKIYKKAKRKNNDLELIKTFFFRAKYMQVLEEDAQVKIISELKSDIATVSEPGKSLLEFVYVSCLNEYLLQNKYKIKRRTETEAIAQDNFLTWTLPDFEKKTIKYFLKLSKSNTILKNQPLKDYEQLLDFEKLDNIENLSLYDFLLKKYIALYSRHLNQYEDNAIFFSPIETKVFGNTKEFLSISFDSLSNTNLKNTSLLYQELERLHPDDETLDFERIQFYENYVFRKNANYLSILNRFQKRVSDTALFRKVQLARANLYSKMASKDKYPDYNAIAIKILDSILSVKSRSNSYKNAYLQKQRMLAKSVDVQLQKYVYEGENTRAFVKFKNTDSLFLKIFKISSEFQFSNNAFDRDSIINELLKSANFEKTVAYKLPNKNDLFSYSTEVLMPKLEKGKYLILFAVDESRFAEKQIYNFTFLNVTDLAVLHKEKGNDDIFQIVNRKTGKPIEDAKIQLEEKQTKTDKDGYAKLIRTQYKPNSDRRTDLKISKGIDSLKIDFFKGYYSEYNEENETFTGDVKFYMDRAIYRPGQKAYVKAIALQNKNGVKSTVPNLTVYVEVYDADNNTIVEREYQTNEFGSFAFEFDIPKNGITGRYTIEADEPDNLENDELYNAEEDEHLFWDNVDFSYNETIFSVEEYKRPTFKVEFNPTTETFAVNDTVQVSGKSISFSGVNLSDSQVSYSVQRESYSSYHYRQGWSDESLTIAKGETTTDSNGEFKIDFPALPYLNLKKEDLPVFEFTVNVAVTDSRSETQTAETLVKVGYHTLELSAEIPSVLNTKNENSVKLKSTNLNGSFLATKGIVEIYFKTPLSNKLKKRIFSKPDIPGFTEKEFERLFPYENIGIEENEGLGTLVFSKEVNTEIDNEISLNFLKTNQSGNYTLIFSATDNLGNKIETSKDFKLLHQDAIVSERLFTINQKNENPFADGFTELEIRSEIKKLYITISDNNESNLGEVPIELHDGLAKIKVPLNNERSEDLRLYFETFFENEFYSEPYTIAKADKGEIDIAIKSFRNKIEPGSKQTWSFTLTKNNKAKEAEVLASMYDSSLDQFKTVNWDALQIHNYYSYRNYSNTRNLIDGIDYINLNALNAPLPLFHFADDDVDLYWFGFDFNNPKGVKNYKNQKKLISKIPDGATMVYGMVTDDTGLPLPGANVIIRGTSRGTQTDFDGYYSIEVAQGEVLDVSYVGFNTNSFIVNSNENNVSLQGGSALDEVVVTGYSVRNQTVQTSAIFSVVVTDSLLGKIPGVQITAEEGKPGQSAFVRIRGTGSLSSNGKGLLIIIDGVPVNFQDENSVNTIDENNVFNLTNLNPNNIANLNVIKGEAATALYGSRAANGVIIINTKTALEELKKVAPRKNFNETAFFYPQLKTDKNGEISFNFTSPESLTQWKLRLFAHDKNALSGYFENMVITQKELMIVPNMPRFFREKDTIQITARISNLTSENKNGTAILQLFDAVTLAPIHAEMGNKINLKNFQTVPKGNTSVSWKINIPEGLQGVQYRILAKAGEFSDGEENIIPVLTNNILVTESIPLWVRENSKREYTFENLKNNTSSTLKNHQLTLEYTSNPTWLAIQALPYLMEYEHECAEQTFSRYYANALASNIINSNPKIAAYFESIKGKGISSELEKNEELKSIILAETPWFNDSQTDEEKNRRLAFLFDLEKMKTAQQATFEKLNNQQMASGGFPWFQGGSENEFITRHILAGFGKLMQRTDNHPEDLKYLTNRGISFLDKKFEKDFKNNKTQNKSIPNYSEIHYLYARSFYLKQNPLSDSLQLKINKKLEILKENWLDSPLYEKGMAALIFERFGDTNTAKKIINNLKETASNNEDWGMYWLENKAGWYWYQSPIETQALIINAFAEITKDKKSVEAMKVWLLKNKQVKHWPTTKSTTEAVDAMLNFGSDYTNVKDKTKFEFGDSKAIQKKITEVEKEAETGYFKINFNSSEMQKEMASLTITNKSEVPGYGGFYWQYFEDLDKIVENNNQPLKVLKEIYLKKNTDNGAQLQKISSENPLIIGDLITVRLIISTTENMEYVHLKDMRASALEPVDVLSKFEYKDGLGYFKSTRDAATHFFFDEIRKGTYVLEYDVRANNMGEFSNGITTIQSMYAPEFAGHSKGIRIKIVE
ncbi:MAG: hypothetical protein CML16_01695 [Pusillimonas sp.]|nr:hypothetical protein [Pusillimonas sp.]|tara:strand:+ start:479 stop:6979 length:6501 start_codon:yes stop_codon:yes gene_type:complete